MTLRITIILGPFYPVPTVLGGAVEKVQLSLAAEIAAAGHQVTIISRQFGTFPKEETLSGVRHMRIASHDRRASLAVNLFLSLLYDIRASRVMPDSDITVTNSFFLPLVLSKRKAGKIYTHVARYPKGQFFLYRRVDRLQTISRAVSNAIVAQDPPSAGKVVVIAYPVPEIYFANAAAKSTTILFVGRLAREKGVELLIRAFSQLADKAGGWKLRIIGPHLPEQGGDGVEYLNELKRLAAPLGHQCEFVGPVFDERQLARDYAVASIFVYPSIAERGEAFGLAPLEAMASGCAVIVSDLSCFDDFIVGGENALKFNHRDPQPAKQLAAALERVVQDPEFLLRLAAAGHVTAMKFRTPVIAQELLADFRSLLGARP